MNTIMILALDGAMDSSLAITFDTLQTAERLLARAGKPSPVKVMVAGYGKTVRTGSHLLVKTDVRFGDALGGTVTPRWVIVPALGLFTDDAISARLRSRDAIAAMDLLRALPRSVRIATSCSSVFLLAATGLLRARQVTTTWWLAHLFRARHPDISLDETKMLVRDGPYLTAGAAYSHLDLMLAVVTDTIGPAIARLCTRYLLIDERQSQARYMVHANAPHLDAKVLAAEQWIDAHLSRPIRLDELSADLAVSPRTLARRIAAATGVSPIKFIQRRRVLHASHLIETTTLSIEEVAARVGYQDGTSLRKLIRREFGTTPVALRR